MQGGEFPSLQQCGGPLSALSYSWALTLRLPAFLATVLIPGGPAEAVLAAVGASAKEETQIRALAAQGVLLAPESQEDREEKLKWGLRAMERGSKNPSPRPAFL